MSMLTVAEHTSMCVCVCMRADLQQVASLMDLLNVLVGEDAAGSLQLALALSGSSGNDGLVQTGHTTQSFHHKGSGSHDKTTNVYS